MSRPHRDVSPDDVSDVLANIPAESMPAEVAARLAAVLEGEVERRRSGADRAEAEAESAAAAARTALGSFGANPIGDKQIRPQHSTHLNH